MLFFILGCGLLGLLVTWVGEILRVLGSKTDRSLVGCPSSLSAPLIVLQLSDSYEKPMSMESELTYLSTMLAMVRRDWELENALFMGGAITNCIMALGYQSRVLILEQQIKMLKLNADKIAGGNQ